MPASVVVGMIAAIVMLAAGIALVWLAASSKRGKFARNHLVGIRTGTTLASDAGWAAGHKAASRQMSVAGWGVIIGAILAAAGGALALLGVSEDAANSIIAALILASSAWAVAWLLVSARTANRAARAADPTPPE